MDDASLGRRVKPGTDLPPTMRCAPLAAAGQISHRRPSGHESAGERPTGWRRSRTCWRRRRGRAGSAPRTSAQAAYRDRIELAIRVRLETLLRHSDYTAANIINYALAPRAVRARHHIHREAYGDCWRELFQAAQSAGANGPQVDLSLLRLLLIGALDWSHEWYRPGDKSISALARDISDMLFDGIE